MKLSGKYNVDGLIAKEDERYQVIDNTTLNNLILSSTSLNPGHSTSGHAHKGQEEVYLFIKGAGDMTLTYPNGDKNSFDISDGDIVLIEDGVHQKVINSGNKVLYFICVFDGKRSH